MRGRDELTGILFDFLSQRGRGNRGIAMLFMLCAILAQSAAALAGEQPTELRIVTFAPALTQMLIDLEMGDTIVGVSEFDEARHAGRPNVGSYIDPNTERLLSLRPTHVLLMATQTGVPPRLKELADRGRFTLKAYPYPNDAIAVGDVLVGLGAELGQLDQAAGLRDRMTDRLNQIKEETVKFDRPRVLLVFGTGPVWASGPGTVNDALLEAINADNAAGDAATTAVTYDREALLRDAPDVILLLLPGGHPLSENDPRLADFAGLPIPAVTNHRIHLIADPLVLLPATHLPRIADQMASAIHPDYDSHDNATDDDQPPD